MMRNEDHGASLHKFSTEAFIKEVVSGVGVGYLPEPLVAAALDGGGSDNVTVLLVRQL